MNYLETITDLVNKTLTSCFPCENRRVLGLAQAVRVEVQQAAGGAQRPKIVPGVYVGNGDVEYSGFDDRYTLCSYHKGLNMTSRRLPGTGYGHEQPRVSLTHNMALVICANVDQIGKPADEMAFEIQLRFPDMLKAHNMPREYVSSVAFNITSITLNAEQVFREEFQNENYFLGPQHALLKVNYTVESVLNKRCMPVFCETQEIQNC